MHACVIVTKVSVFVGRDWPTAIATASAAHPGERLAECQLGHVDAPTLDEARRLAEAGQYLRVAEVRS